jgi:hypothetical protein
MSPDTFQVAAERAAASYLTEVWCNLSASEQAAAIYRELRNLDAESANQSEPPDAEAKAGPAAAAASR